MDSTRPRSAPPARATPPRSWLDREPGLGRIRQELVRLFRRARIRARLVILLSLLAAVSIFAELVRQPDRFMAQVTFRVVEDSTAAIGRPPSPGELRDYILDGIFVKPRLMQVIRTHRLYPSKVRTDPNWAYEQMRDDLQVDVYRNTFRLIGSSVEMQRSAQLRIRYWALDEDLALRVAEDLARLIRDHELEKRRHLSDTAIKVLQLQRSRLLTRLSILERTRAQHTVALLKADTATRARLHVTVTKLDREIFVLRRQARRFSNLLGRASTRAAIEHQGAGIRFKELDWRQVRPRLSSVTIALGAGGVVFLCSLLVIGVLVGAFDPRVYDLEDVRRLGLVPIGLTGRPVDDSKLPRGYDSVAYYLLKSSHRVIGLTPVAGSDAPLLRAAERIGLALALQAGAPAAIVASRGVPGDGDDSPSVDEDGGPGFSTRWLRPRLALLTPASEVARGSALQVVLDIIRQTRMQFSHHLVSLDGLDARGEHLDVLDHLDTTVVLGWAGCFTEHALLQTAEQLAPTNTLGVVLLH